MQAGYYISGAAHALFVAFLLFGGIFARDRLPEVAVTDVSIISEAEFAALSPPQEAPEITTDAAQPEAPETEETAPALPAQDAPPAQAEPEAAEAPDTPDAAPEPLVEDPLPQADLDDTAPQIIAPPTLDDGETLLSEVAPAPAPRIAPEPAAPPPPEAENAPEIADQTAPDPDAATPVEERPATAPEEATTRIVTEADETKDIAPAASIRPRSRPARPAKVAETPKPETVAEAEAPHREDPPDTPTDATAEAIAAAVSEANRTAEPTAARPAGPPLTRGEKDALRVSVQRCWNVGSLSSEALRTNVTVAVSVARNGRPETSSIRLLSSEGGSDAAARQAYEAARRAIIRCGANGFPLPAEKYEQWRDIEMTFNPERMRIK